MNGLLSRLAASAAGSAVVVRSDARLPYGGAGSDWAEAESSEAAPADALAPRSQRVSTAVSREATPQVPQVPPIRLADPDVGMKHTIEPRQRVGPAPLLPGKTARTFDGTESRDPAPPLSADVAANPVPDADRADLPAAPIEQSTLMPSLARPAVAEATPSPFTARNDPARLLPQTRRSSLPSSDTTAPPHAFPVNFAPPQAVAQTMAGDDTEVHVHIGRIDVTAVHEPAPPARRRAAAATRAPMSLDTYLAARNRSGA